MKFIFGQKSYTKQSIAFVDEFGGADWLEAQENFHTTTNTIW